MNNLLIVSIITLLVAFTVTYSKYYINLTKSKKEIAKLLVNVIVLEEYIKSIQDNPIEKDESIHKENFIKFLSESRDWAFQYIEEFQAGLDNFISSVEPEISYFKEHGDIMAMQPNYNSMKKIAEEYEKLKGLLPKEEHP